MIAWGISQLVKKVAISFGADRGTADLLAMNTAGVLTFIDPVGGALGVAHIYAQDAAADGHTGGKIANTTLNTVAAVASLPSNPPGPDPA